MHPWKSSCSANAQVLYRRRNGGEVGRREGSRPVVEVDEAVECCECSVPVSVGPLDNGEVQAGGISIERAALDRPAEVVAGLTDLSQFVINFARCVG